MIFPSGGLGWGHRLGACPRIWPRPSRRPSLRARRLTKRHPVGGSGTDTGAGPRRSWTPPPACLLTKPGRAKGRSSAAEACRSLRASDPPLPFPAGEPPHKAQPFARGVAQGVSTRPSPAPWARPCPRLPASSLRHRGTKRGLSSRARAGGGAQVQGRVRAAEHRPPGSRSAPAVPGPRSHLTKPRPFARGGAGRPRPPAPSRLVP